MKEWQQEEHREQKMYAGADGDAVPEEFREARNKGLYYLQFSGKQKMKCARNWRNRGFRQPLLKMRFFFLKTLPVSGR